MTGYKDPKRVQALNRKQQRLHTELYRLLERVRELKKEISAIDDEIHQMPITYFQRSSK